MNRCALQGAELEWRKGLGDIDRLRMNGVEEGFPKARAIPRTPEASRESGVMVLGVIEPSARWEKRDDEQPYSIPGKPLARTRQ